MDNFKVHLHFLNRNLRRLACTIDPIRSLSLNVFNLQNTFRTTYSMVNLLSIVKVTQTRQYPLKRRRPRKKKENDERKKHPPNKGKTCKCQKMLSFWTRWIMVDCIRRKQTLR
ncbi:hypothetical protein GIB67_030593, partial [Kingdonia uniflora]